MSDTAWQATTDENNIVWLSLNRTDVSANSLSRQVLSELAQHINEVEKNRPKAVIILSSKENGFIAGADVHEFPEFKDEAEVRQLLTSTHELFNRIERLPCPSICLIHGFCFGGGFELALACRYRILLDDPSTRIALPEVRLGIHPGYGGIMRLCRLIGSLPALDLILSGRSISASAAKKLGIATLVVPQRQFKAAAPYLVQHPPQTIKQPPWFHRLADLGFIRPLVNKILSKKIAAKAAKTHYPAPYAVLNIWLNHMGDPQAMLNAEIESMLTLFSSNTAHNLLHVFFLQDQLKNQIPTDTYQAQTIHVIGAGVMGGDIAAWCALQGLKVTLQDQQLAQISATLKRAHTLFKKRLRKPHLIQQAMDRLIPDIEGHGIRAADIVIEAIVENAEIKQQLYTRIESQLKTEAILATNTSSIPLEQLAESLQQPERLVGLHFFNPVAKMQLIEIVQGNATAEHIIQNARCFARQLDRLPLVVTSTPGFLVNRVLMPYLLEAVTIESEGIPAAAIDRAAVNFGMPMGPVELADTVGLDICQSVASILSQHFGGNVPNRLTELLNAGHLGRKSGQGFYTYKKGKAQKPKVTISEETLEDISQRLVIRLLNEAAACLREGVVKDIAALDTGIVFGTGFAPFRGGPMHYAEQMGTNHLVDDMNRLTQQQGVRFKPDEYWKTFT